LTKAFRIIGTPDHLDIQFGAQAPDPVREGFADVPAVHPQNAQPSKSAQHTRQEQLRAVTFGGIGRRPQNPQLHLARRAFEIKIFAARYEL
jgi:hypothetical protein